MNSDEERAPPPPLSPKREAIDDEDLLPPYTPPRASLTPAPAPRNDEEDDSSNSLANIVRKDARRRAAPPKRGATGRVDAMVARLDAATEAVRDEEMSELFSAQREPAAAVAAAAGIAQRSVYVAREVHAAVAGNPAFASPLPRRAILSPSLFDQQMFLRELEKAARDVRGGSAAADELEQAMYARQQVVTRAYEETMLRTPAPHEPECAAHEACYGNRIECAGGGATLVAFFTADERAKYTAEVAAADEARAVGVLDVAEVRLPDLNRRCLLCYRFEARQFYYQLLLRFVSCGDGASPPMLPFVSMSLSNLVNVPGEYCAEDCFGPSAEFASGLVAPVVKPDLFAFRRVEANNHVYFYQKLARPEEVAAAAAAHGVDASDF